MALSSSLPASPVEAWKLASPSSSSATPRSRFGRALVSIPKRPLLQFPNLCKLNSNRASIVKAQLNEVVDGPKDDGAATAESKLEVPVSKGKDPASPPPSEEAISEFLTQVTSLVKLVDSRDIVELEMKQKDCELLIRKKDALPQPSVSAPTVMMHQPPPHVAMPSQYPPSMPAATTPSPPASASAAAPPATLPAPKHAKSSHPPLKSPMSGTFYRSPGPGLQPFVKVGDKVKKGQVLCIIEAMKLMNEIEADQAGTVAEILVDDAKAVGIDQPLFVIEP